MAQGLVKQKAKPTGGSGGGVKKSGQGLKPRGSRQIAPKKQKIIAQQKLLKKHTAGLTALTEKSLAEKAGHLEMLRGGKKEKAKDQKKK